MANSTSIEQLTTALPTENFNDIKGLEAMQTALAVVNLAGAAIILFGNLLVIAAVVKFHSLRTNMFLFMCSLAVADTLVGLSILILTVYNVIYAFDSSDIGMCSIVQWMIVTSMYCTLLNMTFIAIDRSLAINRPLHYHQDMTSRKVTAILIAIWGFSISAGLCLFAGRTEWTINTCTYQEFYLPGYQLFIIIYLYVMSILQVVLYTQLYATAHRQQKKIQEETQAPDQAQNAKSNYRAVKMFMLVVGGFLTCWFPLTVVVTIMYVDIHLVNRTVLLVTYTIACFNSILNPFIYAWKNSKMRRAFKKLLHLPNSSVTPGEDASNAYNSTLDNTT